MVKHQILLKLKKDPVLAVSLVLAGGVRLLGQALSGLSGLYRLACAGAFGGLDAGSSGAGTGRTI